MGWCFNSRRETRNFIDYIFTFRTDNKLIASNASSEIIGNWNVTDDNGSGELYTDISSPNNTDDTPNNPVDFMKRNFTEKWNSEAVISHSHSKKLYKKIFFMMEKEDYEPAKPFFIPK